MSHPRTHSYRFTYRQRLHGKQAFQAVFETGLRKDLGPLSVRARANGLGYYRLGLTVPRRVGTAVRRNRIKRLLREAFRLDQHVLAPTAEVGGIREQGYDLVVVVRPHPPRELYAYRRLLRRAGESIQRKHPETTPTTAPGGK